MGLGNGLSALKVGLCRWLFAMFSRSCRPYAQHFRDFSDENNVLYLGKNYFQVSIILQLTPDYQCCRLGVVYTSPIIHVKVDHLIYELLVIKNLKTCK